ncbi:MAG: septum formation initiator family protein [Clostridia bacterium]|nr:septum formation initiator family protein [Clostridia bacterium]
MTKQLKDKQNVFFRIAVAALLVWVIVSLLQLQIEIREKRSALADLNTQILTQKRINEELADENANDELYLEQQARDKGLAKPGESIYKEVPGNG